MIMKGHERMNKVVGKKGEYKSKSYNYVYSKYIDETMMKQCETAESLG